MFFFFFNDTATTEIYTYGHTLSLHDALPIEGILAAEDACTAVKAGASAVILSNHGGRQLDTAVSGLDMVEEVAEQLDGRAELIVDGGIRRGTDILKAVALGARACMTGRVGLYGLAVGGEAGAARALQLLQIGRAHV